jgi:hypothetical protein
MANVTIQSFVCKDYIPGTMSLLTANPAIECGKEEHHSMIAWALPFFLLFVVIGPLLIAGRMFGWQCTSCLKSWVRVDFLQGSYKNKQEANSQTLKESCQTNFEIILLVRRICLTVVSLVSASLCDDTGAALCTPKVVAVNAVLFASVIIQTVLMPIRNRVHTHFEIGSLVLNFVLFDTALLATSGQGSNVDNVATVSLVLDLVRVVAFLALGGYGVYENRTNLFGLTCQSGLSHVDTSEESALAGYTALVSVASSSEETADAPVAASTSSSNAGSKLDRSEEMSANQKSN